MSDTAGDTDIVRDYLAGRLSDGDALAFEERVAREPKLVGALEEFLRMREGLEVLRERGTLPEVLAAPPPAWRRYALPLAAAAAVAAVAVGVQFLGRAPVVAASLADLRLAAPAPAQVVAEYSLATTRGAAGGPALDLPPAGALELKVLVSGPAGAAYRLALRRLEVSGAASEVGSVARALRDASGFVVAYVDASRLAPGDYSIAAVPQAAAAESSVDLPFRLRRATNPSPPPN
jgi:hypothetical protein